jgi:molecular chaperone DnaK (HSP70)
MLLSLHFQGAVDFIIVFDWGGGTLDVSLLHVHGGMFTTHAIAGNKHLGGEDVTRRLYDHCIAAYRLSRPSGDDTTPLSPEMLQRFRSEAERVKLALSSEPSATLRVDDGDVGEVYSLDITRETFIEINSDLLEATMKPLHTVRPLITTLFP